MLKPGFFFLLQVDEDNNYSVFISFVEVYNNSIFDLLDDTCIDPIKNRYKKTFFFFSFFYLINVLLVIYIYFDTHVFWLTKVLKHWGSSGI